MARINFCIVCAALAALCAMLLLADSPSAQDVPKTHEAAFGDGAEVGVVSGKVRMLGAETPVADFKLLLTAKDARNNVANATVFTDKDGSYRVTLKTKLSYLRLAAFGEYVVPDGWASVPLHNFKFDSAEKTEAWDVRVRPLRDVRVSGRLKIADSTLVPGRAQVAFAPLDVAQDGTTRMFDAPFTYWSDDQGGFVATLPTGYYEVWSHYADRAGSEWIGYVGMLGKVEVFDDRSLELTLERGPMVQGKVIDARTGKGIAARIDLHTNAYMRQMHLSSSDGLIPMDYGPDGEEIIWPIGEFKFQAYQVDPRNVTVVIRPSGSERDLRVIPDVDLTKAAQPLEWKLYTEDMNTVEVTLTTHEADLPIYNVDVRLTPSKLNVPAHIQSNFTAAGSTDAKGQVAFRGLADGEYEAYALMGEALLGTVTLTKAKQQAVQLKFKMPFAHGQVKTEAGEVCKNMMAFIWISYEDGREYGPLIHDAFKNSETLRERGTFLVPLSVPGVKKVTFKVVFGAFEGGRAFRDDEWLKLKDFPLATEPVTFEVEIEKLPVFKSDLTLKANPEYKK